MLAEIFLKNGARIRFSEYAVNASAIVRGFLSTSNLPQLQNLIKRDPVSYKESVLTTMESLQLHASDISHQSC